VLGEEKKCRMRIAYDWDDRRKTFNKTCPCRCPGYLGVESGGCPHEYVNTAPGCVHCGHIEATRKV
jgi:hypothetical protein